MLSLIDQRRRDGADRGDLLSALLAARDEDTGEGLDDRQLRDEVMTLLLAGHETTAMALSWTFYLLSLHPGARRTLEAELDAALAAGATPRLEDLPRLRATRMVLDESLRLYPPAWVITRSADGARRARRLRDPGRLARAAEPVRHAARSRAVGRSGGVRSRTLRAGGGGRKGGAHEAANEAVAGARPRYAYFPFGGGPHLCIGAGFAIMEATIVLATVARRLHLDLEPGRPVAIDPLVTLRPTPGIWVTVRPR